MLFGLIDLVVPLRDDTSSSTILGVLHCARGLLPHINYQEKQSVIRGSFGTKRKQSSQAPASIDYIVQVLNSYSAFLVYYLFYVGVSI